MSDCDKPQIKCKRLLADNSRTSFVHLGGQKDGDDVLHPYANEIRQLLDSRIHVRLGMNDHVADIKEPFTWIEKVEDLQSLAQILSQESEFAVDTEQHSLRSFLGFTALLQVSTRKQDYLVDSIALHDHMDILRPVFADASICKVFHGADSDILWLQRDFHIYVVNLFDTARACDVLSKPQRSLVYLLQTYCDVTTNKIFQKADWRQRPLPDDMLLYARVDTHYLLYIKDRLYEELVQGQALAMANRRSHLICLQLYEKDSNSSPATTAASILAKLQWTHEKICFASQPLEAAFRKVLRRLCEWRDVLARTEDESLRFVLSDAALLALARSCPSTADDVFATISTADAAMSLHSFEASLPSPSPVVEKHVDDLIHLFKSVEDSSLLNDSGVAVNSKATAAEEIVRCRSNQSDGSYYKRMQFVRKFSCKAPVYENCRIYAGDGRLLCYCDKKKLEWYIQRGLADPIEDEETPAVTLRFEPKGRPEDENNEFYIQSKANRCVSCGDGSHYLRYRIVPSCYRQHFPEYLKSHRSHDIVLLCVDCHEIAHRAAEQYKHVIAEELGIPLFAGKVVAGDDDDVGDGDGDDDNNDIGVVESEDGVSPLQLRNAAMALICHGDHMPEIRKEELMKVVSAYYGGRDVGMEDIRAAAVVGIDLRGQKRLSKKIAKVMRKMNVNVKRNEEDDDDVSSEKKKKKKSMSLLGHGLHGKRVVERIWKEEGENGIRSLIQKWRSVFVEALRPAYLPNGWEVTHSGHREFGDFSVYKPPQAMSS